MVNGVGAADNSIAEIVWLFSQDEEGKKLKIEDLEWLVMPLILLKQFHHHLCPRSCVASRHRRR